MPTDWLDEIPGLKDVTDASDVVLPRRNKVKFAGTQWAATDDPSNQQTVVTFAGGGAPGIVPEVDTGNNAATNTTGISDAIAAAVVAGGGRVSITTPGTYSINPFTVSAGVTFECVWGVILQTTVGNVDIITLEENARCVLVYVKKTSGAATAGAHFASIADGAKCIECTSEAGWNAFDFSTGTGQQILDCHVISASDDAITLSNGVDTAQHCTVRGCTVDTSVGHNVSAYNCADLLVTDCHFCETTGSSKHNVHVGADVGRARFVSNTALSASGDAVKLTGSCNSVIVRDNQISSATGYAISVDAGVTQALIRDNAYDSNGLDGIQLPTLTIASGVIALSGDVDQPVFIDTEAAASSDNLDTINGGRIGQRVTLRAANSARDVVFKDATGNLQLNADFTADHINDTIVLEYDGVNWVELFRSNNN
jgi:hypothetical protein